MDPPPSADPTPMTALVVAPLGRDASLAARELDGLGLRVEACGTAQALCEGLRRPDLGLVLLTAEGLQLPGMDCLGEHLASEAEWSEVPVVLFVSSTWSNAVYLRLTDRLGGRRGVTVLERPIRPVAFRSVISLAVEARRRQFEVRDLLARVRAFNSSLQQRVDDQTAELRERAEKVQALAEALNHAESQERERIAQLLHDDLQQLLYGLKIHVDILATTDGADTEVSDRIQSYLDEAISQTRQLTTELHPPTLDDEGIGAALGWVANSARTRYGLTVHLDVEEDGQPAKPEALALMTRVARELLLNVVKHAGTREAWVRAWRDAGGCHLLVRDEGDGMDTGRPARSVGRGLRYIRQRLELVGGTLTVESVPNGGTEVSVVVPLGHP